MARIAGRTAEYIGNFMPIILNEADLTALLADPAHMDELLWPSADFHEFRNQLIGLLIVPPGLLRVALRHIELGMIPIDL